MNVQFWFAHSMEIRIICWRKQISIFGDGIVIFNNETWLSVCYTVITIINIIIIVIIICSIRDKNFLIEDLAGLLYLGWAFDCWWTSRVKQEDSCTADSCTGMVPSQMRFAYVPTKMLVLNGLEFLLQDSLVETAKEEASSISNIIAQATK